MEKWYVASLVLQIRQEKFDQVKQVLLSQVGNEIYVENALEGKLVLVIEASDESEFVARMEGLQEIEGVVAVSLVYSYQDIL